MDTWCSNSRREVPRFIKILDEVDFYFDNHKIFCLNREKTKDGLDISDLNIKFVPIFIIYRDDIEIGKIAETHSSTIKKDLITILSSYNKLIETRSMP